MDALTQALQTLPTPCYVVDEAKLESNLQILKSVADEAGCKILLAQKAFSMFSVYPLIGKYLAGTAASGLYEARLGREETGGEVHVFSPAYTDGEFEEILRYADHIVFNSFAQWEKFKEKALAAGKRCGIRVNPEYSTQDHAIYDPCAPYSRLGVTRANFREDLPDGLDGLHLHTLCEQDSDALTATVAALEEKFSNILPRMRWLNLGGGHHITKPGYDLATLVACIRRLKETYRVEVYLEPGEAIALQAGFLAARVIDVVENGMPIAILDASAACHMPDVIEMPYRPPLRGAGLPQEKPCTYRLAGPTCLAGDVIGDYSFDRPLHPAELLLFEDMAIYTMVKNNTFNGMKLPSIALLRADGKPELVKTFGYSDFKERLS